MGAGTGTGSIAAIAIVAGAVTVGSDLARIVPVIAQRAISNYCKCHFGFCHW